MNISTKKKITDLENRLVAAWGEREGVGGIGSLGLMDANYCLWNGFTMRSCCVALRTMSRCKCNLASMLYSRKKNKLKNK